MAAYYIKALRTVQPEGPYFLEAGLLFFDGSTTAFFGVSSGSTCCLVAPV